MSDIKIKINTIEQVKEFTWKVSSFDEDIDIISGKYKLNAKSIMGIFALDLSNPVIVSILSDDQEILTKFEYAMEEFKC